MTEKDYFKITQIGFIGWWMVNFDCDNKRKIERRVKRQYESQKTSLMNQIAGYMGVK
jgi:hypothetical protein